jgi:hypothetical protein
MGKQESTAKPAQPQAPPAITIPKAALLEELANADRHIEGASDGIFSLSIALAGNPFALPQRRYSSHLTD